MTNLLFSDSEISTMSEQARQTDMQEYDFSRSRFEEILQALGEPYKRGDCFAIYQGDCIDLLDAIPSGSIDLTFTSPPYNIGKEYERIMPIDEYIDWCETWLSGIYQATSRTGGLLLNLGYVSLEGKAKAIPLPYLLWNKTEFYFMQEIIWNYGAGVAAKKFLSPRNEKLLWYVKNSSDYVFNLDDIRDPNVAYPNQKKNGKLRCNTIGKNPSDVWQIAKVTSGALRASPERTPHPAQFPLDLCTRVIKGFSPSQGIILDPFLGSGSSVDAALRNGRFSIGFELREDYCKIAAERAESALNQLKSLF